MDKCEYMQSDIRVSGNSKMAVKNWKWIQNNLGYISACIHDSNEIPTPTHVFGVQLYAMGPIRIPHDVSGCGKSKMAAIYLTWIWENIRKLGFATSVDIRKFQQ